MGTLLVVKNSLYGIVAGRQWCRTEEKVEFRMKKVLWTLAIGVVIVATVTYAKLAPLSSAETAVTITGPNESDVRSLVANRQLEPLLGQYETALENARQALEEVQAVSDEMDAIVYSNVTVPSFDPMFLSQMGLSDLAFSVHLAKGDLKDSIMQATSEVVAAANLVLQPTITPTAVATPAHSCVLALENSTNCAQTSN